MNDLISFERVNAPKFGRRLLLSTAGVIGLVGCGDDVARPQPDQQLTTVSETATSTAVVPATQAESSEFPLAVFDDLGGGSPVIMVYPSGADTPEARVSNGEFMDGQSAPAKCVSTGRTVESDPSVGEEFRQSDQWVEIQGSAGETQVATAVYLEDPEELIARLPQC